MLPFSSEIVRVEIDGETIVAAAPDAAVTTAYQSILDAVLSTADAQRVIPTPLEDGDIRELYLEHLAHTGDA